MDLELRGKKAIVTGASKGIGRAVAEVLASEGCDVVLVSRTQETLEAAAAEIRSAHNVGVSIQALDLSDSGSIEHLLEAVGTPDILVNNAGAIPGGTIDVVDEATWRTAWDLKVFGYINMTRAFYAAMKERGDGVIINVTGLAADRTDAGYIAGTPANASLNAFSRALGGRSLNDGIRVLAVSPGLTETERLVTLLKTAAKAKHGDEARWREGCANLPGGRPGTPTELANVIAFAASPRASYLSGVVINVDGGHGSNLGNFG